MSILALLFPSTIRVAQLETRVSGLTIRIEDLLQERNRLREDLRKALDARIADVKAVTNYSVREQVFSDVPAPPPIPQSDPVSTEPILAKTRGEKIREHKRNFLENLKDKDVHMFAGHPMVARAAAQNKPAQENGSTPPQEGAEDGNV